jgi:hypothetical protein
VDFTSNMFVMKNFSENLFVVESRHSDILSQMWQICSPVEWIL